MKSLNSAGTSPDWVSTTGGIFIKIKPTKRLLVSGIYLAASGRGIRPCIKNANGTILGSGPYKEGTTTPTDLNSYTYFPLNSNVVLEADKDYYIGSLSNYELKAYGSKAKAENVQNVYFYNDGNYGDDLIKHEFPTTWVAGAGLEYTINENPTLNLSSPPNNQTLTENATLNIQGTASDTDKDNVVTIKYRINNGTARALQSGVSNGSTPISFAKTLTFRTKRLYDGSTDLTGSDLAENTDHTLTIWAEDDQGGKSTEITRKFRVVHNRPPVINGQNVDLGVLSAIPSKTYTVTEPEGDAFTITEKINGKVIRTFAGTDGKENTATIPLDTWLRLSLTAVHTLTIEATDSKGMTSTRSYTFRRSADKIAFALRNPFGTDIAAKRILVTIDATIPAGADYKAEVCNNAFDELPTWEDATNHVKFNRGFIFTNKEKTAEKWGVSVRFSFTKGTATEPLIVKGFGGAFD